MIYDGFRFFNELELLDIRLHELDPVVDKFIIVESTETFSGRSKELIFDKNRNLFSEFSDKIIHIVAGKSNFTDAMQRDFWQFDHVIHGLKDVTSDDLVMVGGLDEIPRAERIREYVAAGNYKYRPFRQNFFMYYLNGFKTGKWNGTAIFPAEMTKHDKISQLSLSRQHGVPIREGGWHFSWLGKPEDIKTKIEAYGHQNINTVKNKDLKRIQGRIDDGLDLISNRPIEYWDFDDRFPVYVRENREKFNHLIHE